MKPSKNELKQMIWQNPDEIRLILKREEGIASVAIETIIEEDRAAFYLVDLIQALGNQHAMVQESVLYAIEKTINQMVNILKTLRADQSRDAWVFDAIDEVLENIKENIEE